MSWELVRDIGLNIFILGAILFFVPSKIHDRVPQFPDTLRMRTIGDGMMLTGACLALIAMLVGYWVLSARP